jgi:integrase
MIGKGRIYPRSNCSHWWIAYQRRGKEIRESSKSDDREKAEKLLERRLREVANDREGIKAFVGPQQDRLTVARMLDALESDFRLRGLKSLQKAKGHLQIVRRALGDLKAVDVTTETTTRYIEQQLAEGKAAGTINRRTALLGGAFRLAIKRHQLSSMPEIPKLREDNAREGFFASREFFAVLSNLGDQDVADFMEWFFWTGMRPGEIRSLTWRAFDSETWTLRLHAKGAKIGVGRVIALEGPLRAIVERRMRTRRFGCDLIFHRDGELMRTFYKRWKHACLLAGVTGKIPYDLRRTAVRNMIRAGVPERVAMSISGHKTRAIFDRYNIVSETDLREAVRKTFAYVEGLADGPSTVPINRQAVSGSIQ